MARVLTAPEILDRHFLEARSKILDLAATLDRLQRADPEGQLGADPRLALLRGGIEILLSQEPARAERMQMLFSDPYVSGWQKS